MSCKTTAEKNLWAWLSQALVILKEMANMPKLHWERIENSLTKGTLDVEGCYGGNTFWLELKSKARGKKIKLGLSVAQAMFMLSRIAAGGTAFVLVKIGGDKLYLIHGKHAKKLVKPVTEAQLAGMAEWLMEDTQLEILAAITGR